MRAALPRASSLILFAVFLTAMSEPREISLFEDGSHCVAYRVNSTVMFFKSSTVTGRNCDASAQVLPEVGGLYHIEVNIPIRSFDSGDGERDKQVAKILKAQDRPELVFKSVSLAPEKWRENFTKQEFELEGSLSIADKTYPVKLTSRYTKKDDAGEVDGKGKVKFADFGLKPPTRGGGVFVSSKPEFELHFHFVSSRILGADSIRPKGD